MRTFTRITLVWIATGLLSVAIRAQDATLPYHWINVHDTGAVGDGQADDTRAIESALRAARAVPTGGAVFIPAGTYRYSGNIRVDSIPVYGAGLGKTILTAGDGAHSAWVLTGHKPIISDLTIRTAQPGGTRDPRPEAVGIDAYLAQGFVISRVEVGPVNSAGIIIRSSSGSVGEYAAVRDCIVHRTLADGIHMTAQSHHLEVAHNRVSDTGDDFIAVVSYRKNGGVCHDILIHDNQVADQPHGRGISVVGGSAVTIEANTIKRSSGAGIYLASEASYDTYGDSDIRVLRNTLTDVATTASLGHGAILLVGRALPSLAIKNITIDGNRIDGCTRSGLYIGAYSSGVTITGNEIANVAACGISVYPKVTDILIGTGEPGVPPNRIKSCGEHGIQVDPVDSHGVLRISGVRFESINTKGSWHGAAINIGKNGTFASTYLTDNQLDQPASLRLERFIESRTAVTEASRNTANVDPGSLVAP